MQNVCKKRNASTFISACTTVMAMLWLGYTSAIAQQLSEADSPIAAIERIQDDLITSGYSGAREQVAALASEAWQQNFSSNALHESLQEAELIRAASVLEPYLDADRRSQLLSILRERILLNQDVFFSCRGSDYLNLLSVLERLSVDEREISEALQQWLSRHLGNAEPSELAAALNGIERGQEYDGIRKQAAQAAWDGYLSRDEYWASISGKEVHYGLLLAERSAYLLTYEQVIQMEALILEALAYRNGALLSRSPDDMMLLSRALSRFDAPKDELTALISGWVENSTLWQQSSPVVLQQLINVLKRTPGDRTGNEVKQTLASYLLNHFLSEDSYLEYANTEVLAWNIRVVGTVWTQGEKERWAQHYQTFLFDRPGSSPPTFGQLEILGKILENADMDGGGRKHTRHADAVVDAFDSGTRLVGHMYWEPKFIGVPLQADSVLRDVKQRLLWISPDGQVNLDMGRVLAFSHRLAGDKSWQRWKRFVESKLSRSEVDGDAKASWLLLNAYTKEIDPARWDYLAGQGMLSEAIEVSDSEEMRFQAISWLVWRRVNTRHPDDALAIIQKYRNEFTSPGLVKSIRRIRIDAEYRSNKQKRNTTPGSYTEEQRLLHRIKLIENEIGSQSSLHERTLRSASLEKLKERLNSIDSRR